ncbi:hypothetical protein IJH29_01270 [Candidatus Saccharibacteria bacterium]|nr:hypothetical protein [Candidatus Saccharibacteria bacterium]
MKNPFKKRGQKLVASSEAHLRRNFFRRISHIGEVRLLVVEWGLLVFVLFMFALTQSFWYSESYSMSAFTSGGTFTEATLGKVSSLNPLFASTSSEKTLSKLLFAGLTAADSTGHVSNALASSVRTPDSGKVWLVKLRSNLKWSDGEPLTNADVLFTTALIQNPAVNSSYQSALSRVSVSENAEGEIVFELPSSYADFPTTLDFPILPKHILESVDPATLLESNFSISPVSSGAFSYNATQSIGSSGESVVYLSANQHYYKGTPRIASFVVHAYASLEDIKSALKSGSVSATAELLPTDAQEVSSRFIYQKQTAINSGVFLFFNTKTGLFKNKSLRKAVQSGLDIAEIRSLIDDELPLDYPILKSQLALEQWPTLPEHNLSAAKETIASSEVKDITLVTVQTGYFPNLAEDISEQLTAMGFSVNKQVYAPGQEFMVNVIASRSYDILLYEVDLGLSPDLLVYYHSSQASASGLNLSNYNSSVSDDLILSARETVDENIKKQKYEAFLSRWVDDAPAIGLYQVNMSYFFDKNVKTFSEDNSLVAPTDRFADIKFWSVEKALKNRTP